MSAKLKLCSIPNVHAPW